MSRAEWLVLFLVLVAYVLLGGLYFHEIESKAELEKLREDSRQQKIIHELVSRELRDGSSTRDEVLSRLSTYCGKPLVGPVYNKTQNSTSPEEEEEFTGVIWDFYNAFFVAITVVTTIGYGNTTFATTASRMFCIVYALIGIPLCGILLAGLGEYFSRTFLRAHHRYREAPEVESRWGLIIKVSQYLAAGICIFILLPAVVFAVTENWSYEDSVYYAFITLSTIGFGDFVAGYVNNRQDWKHSESLLGVYRTFIVLWIIFGLGYLAMILSFITRAMRSSRIRRLEQRVAKRFKNTHTRLWQGASRDLRYLRRVLNELYMLKFKVRLQQHHRNRNNAAASRRNNASSISKPIVRFDIDKADPLMPIIDRSQSLCSHCSCEYNDYDDDYFWYIQPVYRHSLVPVPAMRGRSLSLPTLLPSSEPQQDSSLRRSLSESCLDMIDRNATFAAAPRRVDTSELLATVVDALVASAAASEAEEDLGYHGFADAEILASEEPVSRSRANSIAPSLRSLRSFAPSLRSKGRSRTGSVASINQHADLNHKVPRSRGSGGSPISLRKALAIRSAAAAAAAAASTEVSGASTPALRPVERRPTMPRDPWARRRSEGAAMMSPARMRATSLAPRLSPPTHMQQLDDTTLGDLLRALHSLHSRVDATPRVRTESEHEPSISRPSLSRHESSGTSSPRPQRLAQRLLSRLENGDVESGVRSRQESTTIPEEAESPTNLQYHNERARKDSDSDSDKSVIISRL